MRQKKQSRPEFVNITSRQPGTLFPVNPPVEVYRDSTLVFDLSNETLSYLINTTRFPAFLFKLYTDAAFTQEYETDVDGFVFTTSGTAGQSGATATLTVNKNTPKTLYYRLEPIRVTGNKSTNLEIVSSDEVDLYNQINIKDSVFDGKYTISGVAGTSFQYSVSEQPEATSYSGTTSVLSYTTDSLTASGPISALDLKDRRKGYSRLPGISTITTSTGTEPF